MASPATDGAVHQSRPTGVEALTCGSARAGAALACLAALAVGGCSSSPFDSTLLLVQVNDATALPAGASHTAGVTLASQTDGHCPLSAGAVLTVGDQSGGVLVGDQSWPFGNCFADGVPLAGNSDVALKIWNGTNSADEGQAVLGGLDPGFDATIVSPLSGAVAAGGDIHVSVPEALRNFQPLSATFVYLGTDDPSYSGEDSAPAFEGSGSSMTVPAPAHAGKFRFSVLMNSSDPSLAPGVVVSCFGFAKCAAVGTSDIGPFEITVLAPPP